MSRCGNDCQSAWAACNEGSDLPHEMPECTNNSTLGNDCGERLVNASTLASSPRPRELQLAQRRAVPGKVLLC